jgi:3-oxoacyl-[acyl-carrier-protein] synthase II
MIKRNRVVITGMGIVAPNGIGIEPFWESLLAGRSGIGPITLFDATGFKSRIAGEVKNFNPLDYIEPELKPKRWARHTQFAYAAAMMALKDAGLEFHHLQKPVPIPVIIGVSTSAMDILERGYREFSQRGPNNVNPNVVPACQPQAPANIVADRIGVRADAIAVSSACPSGLDAVMAASDLIGSGESDIAIAGGTDAAVTPLGVASFIGGGLIGESNGEPERASRPFDASCHTGVLSEGSGVFVLENLERALSRGARSYLEISGYSKRRDEDPGRPGCGLAESMKLAIANSGCNLADIDHICAYGPGDRSLDAAEIEMIKQVFGERAAVIPINSIKGVTGNPLAAGGPFQIASCALSIRDQIIPPTANHETKDPECDLDFVPGNARKARIERALINVRGIGGSASSLVVNRVLAQ